MKPITKTVLTSFVAVVCLSVARIALAAYTSETSGLTTAASALYGAKSGVSSDIISIVGGAINAVLGLVGTFFLILIIYSGSLWMTSRGNQEQIKRAQNTMTSAVIGIIIVMGSYTVTGFVIDQILGATGYGSDVDLVTETQDAVNRPDLDLSGCDQDAFNACLQREDVQGFEQSTRDQICQIECGAASATDPTECDQAGYEKCVNDNSPDEIQYCLIINGCDTEDPEEDTSKTPAESAACWTDPAGDCYDKPYDDQACMEKCGGSNPAVGTANEDGTASCIDECINKYHHSISACNVSCAPYQTCYSMCIEDCSDAQCKSDCAVQCSGKIAPPNSNPTSATASYDDCVDQCINDAETILLADLPTCQQQCTGVEADNPLISDTCYADCFASNPSVLGEDLGYDATTFYCNKTCLNPDVVTAEVNQICWESHMNISQIDRLQACMIDRVCWDKCKLNQHDDATCLNDCRMVHYD